MNTCVTFVLFAPIILSSCSVPSSVRSPATVIDRSDTKRRDFGSMFGDSLTFHLGAKPKRTKESTDKCLVNRFLWRGALDMFGFMPIRNASPQTGCIRTDWYTAPETPQMRIRMTVQIRGQVLRADAVTVHVHRQKFERNAWIEYPLPAKECTKLEVLVVDKARRLLRECPSS